MQDPGAKLFIEALSADRVFKTSFACKEDILNFLMEALWLAGEVQDLEALRAAVFMRESLMSTGIGLGVGVPHARLSSVQHLSMALAVNQHPLDDYESIDGHPVRIVAMIIGRTDQQSNYVRLLGALSRIIIKEAPRRDRILEAPTPEDIHRLLLSAF